MVLTRWLFSTVPEFLHGKRLWFEEARLSVTLLFCEGKEEQLFYLETYLQSKIPLGKRLAEDIP